MPAVSSLQIDEARLIPLDTVLTRIGLKPKREGSSSRYKNEEFNIVVSNHGLWYDNAASVGGRGAIDLALHLRCRVEPRSASPAQIHEAIDWLGDSNGGLMSAPTASSSPALEREPFASQAARLAIRDDARWPMARDYLVHFRRIPSELVESLHHDDSIYATFSEARPEQTGVCFVHRDIAGEVRGATVRTVAAGSHFLFSIGEKQEAWFTVGHPAQARNLVAVEAPIDALSYHALQADDATIVMAMSCAHVFPQVLQLAHERRLDLTLALDNDRAGHAGTLRCYTEQASLYPGDPTPHRRTPVLKDWNDDLRTAMSLSHGRGL